MDVIRWECRRREALLLLLVFLLLEQLGARLERVVELGLRDEEDVVREELLARLALAQLLQPLFVRPRHRGGDARRGQ